VLIGSFFFIRVLQRISSLAHHALQQDIKVLHHLTPMQNNT